MRSVTHQLDTSAVLAHCFDGPGADFVGSLWTSGPAVPAIGAITAAELKIRLGEELSENLGAQEAVERCLDELTVIFPVDRTVTECARQLKLASKGRLPLVDAIVAATAKSIGATLVHRDPHFRAIQEGLLGQVELPA